jgi:hypothetical protein
MNSFNNGKMTLYEDPIERELGTTANSLTYSDNLHAHDILTSPPLILRSYTSFQASTTSSSKQQTTRYHDIDNDEHHHLIDSLTPKNHPMKLSMDYIHRLVEQNERRYEQQEHNATIGQEWQILSRVVDRLLVFIFLFSTMLVFSYIFLQAPHLRLK